MNTSQHRLPRSIASNEEWHPIQFGISGKCRSRRIHCPVGRVCTVSLKLEGEMRLCPCGPRSGPAGDPATGSSDFALAARTYSGPCNAYPTTNRLRTSSAPTHPTLCQNTPREQIQGSIVAMSCYYRFYPQHYLGLNFASPHITARYTPGEQIAVCYSRCVRQIRKVHRKVNI